MNVLVFTAYTRWPLHYETDLDIMQRHLDEGDTVSHLHCDGELLACDDNAYHLPDRCNDCISVRRQGWALLAGEVKSRPFLRLTPQDRHELASLKKRFDSIADLRASRVDNFDIGWAVLSSVISWTRDPRPDINACRNLIPRFMVAAFCAYRSVQNYLREHPTDRVYVFNGRFAHARAVLRACQSVNVPCFTHERGNDLGHYALFENTMPHDLAFAEKEIRRKWAEAQDDPHREEIGERFFVDRSKGVIQSWYSFIDSQRMGLLPADWDPKKRNIAIFNSSEDEFESVGDDYVNPLYPTQQDGLERIIESLSTSSKNVHLYLRVHPNLRGLDNYQTRQLATLKADFLTVLPPNDPVSSYTLLKHADKVLTFGSTVGIEAVFWGTASVLAGPSFYRNLGGTYNPSSHEELMELMYADLAPKEKTPSLMFGYYFNTYGVPFKYYKALNMNEGMFKGEKLNPNPTRWKPWERAARIRPVRFMRNAVFTLRSRLRATGSFLLK